MADFSPLPTASSNPVEPDGGSRRISAKAALAPSQHRQLWKKIGLVGSFAVIGGQPVLAQIEDTPTDDAVAPLVAAETERAVAPDAPEATAAPELAAPTFSKAVQPVALPQVEALTDSPEATVVAPNVEVAAPNAEVVTPSEVVPDTVATSADLAAYYGGVFVDPTEYGEGATLNPDAPEVVVAAGSTECETAAADATGDSGGGCRQPDEQPDEKPAAVASAPEASIKIGPVSIGRSGVRFSGAATSVAGREYYNTIAKPLVELQAGESFVFPLASPSPITSLFGWRWHPIHHDYRFHSGTDLGAPQGTPILATQAGQVSVADYLGGYGLTVIMRHNDNSLESRYAHMSHILVQPGEWVEQGEVIGLVGSTGHSTGPHLHFELRQLTGQGWVAINPNEVLSNALANLNRHGPLQALNFMPKAQAAQATLSKSMQTETQVVDSNFRPAQPNAQ